MDVWQFLDVFVMYDYKIQFHQNIVCHILNIEMGLDELLNELVKHLLKIALFHMLSIYTVAHGYVHVALKPIK